METAAQRIARLVGALHTLSSDADFQLANGEFEAVADLQGRCAPLVDEIARLMVQPGVAGSLDRRTQELAQAVLTGQLQQIEKLKAEGARVREQLNELTALQARTRAFRGAYSAYNEVAPGMCRGAA
jgi:hypothetical protein